MYCLLRVLLSDVVFGAFLLLEIRTTYRDLDAYCSLLVELPLLSRVSS